MNKYKLFDDSKAWQSGGAHRSWLRFSVCAMAMLLMLSLPKMANAAATPLLVSPNGAGVTADTAPTFSWSEVTSATWYRFFIRNAGGGNNYDIWIKGTGIGSFTLPKNLARPSGVAQEWYVQAWSSAAGYSPWSAMGVFTPQKTGTISLNLYGANPKNGAVVAGGFTGVLQFPNIGTPNLGVSFTVPEDFADTQFTGTVVWSSSQANCNYYLRPNYVVRARHGHATTTGSASGGLLGPDAVTAPAVLQQGVASTFTLGAGQGFADILPGDALAFGLYRWSANALDTCTGTMTIRGLSLQYKAK